MITSIAIFIGSILGLIIISAFFSGSETALTAISKARIRHLADEGDKRAKELEKLIAKQDTLISTLLVGSNLVNILASVLATSLFISLFGEVGVVIATFVMTTLVVIFAEILPKMIALENSDRWSLKSSFLIKITIIILGPVAILAQKISSFFVRKNTSLKKLVDAHDEIRGQISIHHQEGEVKKGDRDMLGGILDLPDVNVEDVMVHRKNITAININEIDESKITEILSSPYTRIPVWEESTDNFIGLLHIKSLIKEAIKSDNDLKKTKLNVKNKKITNISKIHEFFYEQSNYKVGASENNLQIDINENREELFNNYYFENNSEKYDSLSNKKFLFSGKITKNKLHFNIKNKIIYTLSILGFVIILGLLLFFISQSKKNESSITNESIFLGKRF